MIRSDFFMSSAPPRRCGSACRLFPIGDGKGGANVPTFDLVARTIVSNRFVGCETQETERPLIRARKASTCLRENCEVGPKSPDFLSIVLGGEWEGAPAVSEEPRSYGSNKHLGALLTAPEIQDPPPRSSLDRGGRPQGPLVQTRTSSNEKHRPAEPNFLGEMHHAAPNLECGITDLSHSEDDTAERS